VIAIVDRRANVRANRVHAAPAALIRQAAVNAPPSNPIASQFNLAAAAPRTGTPVSAPPKIADHALPNPI